MIDFYDAFISYKHAELDTKVATNVQRSLERFKIPSAIRKKTGKQSIQRIFRDKDELPITSDLSNTISDALEKSEYLIVICSPNTKTSMWVTREIEVFLKNHSKDHILAVLAGGESADVIPKELREDDIEIVDDEGNIVKTKGCREPLACDCRMSFRQARKEEIPRLAAALIGCSYDELVQRQRQYKMRRMAVLFSIVLAIVMAFAGYMFYSRQRLDKSYREVLANQSRYLANESLRLYENDMRVDALQLALASVPASDKDKRPVTAESVKALTTATHAYQGHDSAPYELYWDYKMPNRIKSYVVSSDGAYLSALDYSGNMTVWNTEDHSIVLSSKENDPSGLAFAKDDSLLVWNDRSIKDYDIPDGSVRWLYEFPADNYSCFSINQHLEYASAGMYFSSVSEKTDGTLLMSYDYRSILLIDVHSGTVKGNMDFSELFNDVTDYKFTSFALSPDEDKIVFVGFSEEHSKMISVYDFSTGKSCSTVFSDSLRCLEWADNDRFIVDYYVVDTDYMGSLQIGDVTVLSDSLTHIKCYEASDLNVLWDKDIVYRGVGREGMLAHENDHTMIYYVANSIYVFDVKTGEIVHGGTVDGQIIDVTPSKNGGMPVFFTDAGDRVIFDEDYSSNAFIYGRRLATRLNRAIQNNGVYVHKFYDSRILYYKKWVVDDDLTMIEDDYEYSSSSIKRIIDDGYLAVITRDEDYNAIVCLYNAEDPGFIDSVNLSDRIDCNYDQINLLSIYDNKLYVFCNNSSCTLVSIDINSGEVELTEFGRFQTDTIYMNHEKIVYVKKVDSKDSVDEETQKLVIYNVLTDSKKSYPIDFIPDYTFLSLSGNAILCKENHVLLIDTENGEKEELFLSDSWLETSLIRENAAGSLIALTDGQEIVVIDNRGIIQSRVQCDGMKPIGLAIENLGRDNGEVLLVAYQNSQLNRYDALSGSLIGSSGIDVYADVNEQAEFIIDENRHQLYIQMKYSLAIVETETWIETALVEDCLGYSGKSDKFFAWRSDDSDTNPRIGYFNHYSLEDLKRKAESLLVNTEMTDEFRAQYGI